MKHTLTAGMVAILLVAIVTTPGVYAHGGVEHETQSEATLHEAGEPSLKQMEELILLLKKYIALLQAKRSAEMSPKIQFTIPAVVVPEAHDDHEEMEEHHGEHSVESVVEATPAPALKIEVEAHYDKTHVHVRYVDEPEAMFFIDATLSDKDGVIRQTAERTGLSEDAVRAAIVYLGVE